MIKVREVITSLNQLGYFSFFARLYQVLANYTGCPTGTDIKFTMNARPQDHFHTSHIWQNFHYTCTFWSCVCKNYEAFPIFFKFGRNFDAQILKICILYTKLRIKQTRVLFCKYLRNESFNLYEILDLYLLDSKEISKDFW